MKLKELKVIIDEAIEHSGECNPNVEIRVGKSVYAIGTVGQFGIEPDVIISVGKKIFEDKF